MSDGDDIRLSPLLILLWHLFFVPFYVHHVVCFYLTGSIFFILDVFSILYSSLFSLASVFLIRFSLFLSIYTFSPFLPVPLPDEKKIKAVKFPLSHLAQIQHCRQAGSAEAVTYQNVNRAVFFTLLHRLFLVAEQEQAGCAFSSPDCKSYQLNTQGEKRREIINQTKQ